MVILLIVIHGYFINGYYWLLYSKLLLVIICYITTIGNLLYYKLLFDSLCYNIIRYWYLLYCTVFKFFMPFRDTYIRMAFCLETPKEESQNCHGLDFLQICETITFCSDVRLGRGLKQTFSSRRKLFKGVSHFACTHYGWVDSRFSMVGSQTGNVTLDFSFCPNLCCRCSNGSCKPTLDIYTSITFQ
jgi:hypothetical protein